MANGHNVAGRVDEPEADEFKKLGVNAVIEKRFTPEKLVEALKTADALRAFVDQWTAHKFVTPR